ncbi:MAG: transporter substrate-binding domain-containing protein [Pseudomonadota bacterium]
MSPLSRLTLLAAALLAASVAAAQEITVAWRDKPPLNYLENGVEKGPLMVRARQVFGAAGIQARFVKLPTKRIWASFESGTRNFCSFGWYRLPAREALAQFSVPFHVDPPHQVLIAPNALAAVAVHASLAALLADPALTLGVVDGVSYGAQLDALIGAGVNRVQRRTVEPGAMMRMVAAGRVSFMFTDPEDWSYARAHDSALQQATLREFPDMPPGVQRYIVCSKDVAPIVMERINRAIEATWSAPVRK